MVYHYKQCLDGIEEVRMKGWEIFKGYGNRIKYEPYKRNKAALALMWDLSGRNHEITLLKLRHIRLREKFGEALHVLHRGIIRLVLVGLSVATVLQKRQCTYRSH